MPNYAQFEGDNYITNPLDRVAADIIIRNELGGKSDFLPR